ncbi:MAG: NrfD/PsrC family molybdoenzyme membrane anchor subunit [Pseudonocardia sediminis]
MTVRERLRTAAGVLGMGGPATRAQAPAIDTASTTSTPVEAPHVAPAPQDAGARDAVARGDARPVGDGPGGGRRRRKGGRGEALMVPDAEFRSYYDRPIIKPPVWKKPDVPAYLYLGGVAGVSSTLAALGDLTGRPSLRRVGRLTSAGAAVSSVVFLVHDLGRPARFLHMMRVFKPTSPLSMGSWILATFSTFSGASAALELTGLFPRLGRLSGIAAGVFGPAMITYTAVLFSDTAVPAWHDAYEELPFVFAGSAMAAGGSVCLLTGRDAAPARRVAVAGAALEVAAITVMERRIGYSARAYTTGRAGTVLRAARAATITGGIAAAASGFVRGRRGRLLGIASALLLNGASAATRYGVFEAGMVSARDPAYIVVPQRERMRAREAEANGTS